MALPANYTDNTLAQYMLNVLTPQVYDCFSWTTSSFDEEINDVLLVYGAETVASMTKIGKVRILATYFAWRKALRAASKFINNGLEGDRREQEKIWAHIKAAYDDAASAAAIHLAAYEDSLVEDDGLTETIYGIEMGAFVFTVDPYAPIEVTDG